MKAVRLGALAAVALLVVAGCTSSPSSAPPPSPSPVDTTTSEPGGASPAPSPRRTPRYQEFDVIAGSRPHDVAPAPDGRVWYTAQSAGALGVLNPRNKRARHIPLGAGSAPHGVIVGPDGAPWITDSGLNAIVRVDPETERVQTFPIPGANVGLNTAAFDGNGILWFTGASGFYGRVNPRNGAVRVFDAPRGEGPYGITSHPRGPVWFSSLAQSYIARVASNGSVRVADVPTSGGGARRVWSDSAGHLWVTEWYAGNLARYDAATKRWREWRLPGSSPQPYAVYVDEHDMVWVTDFGANALVRFNPRNERFRAFTLPSAGSEVRQLLGRPGEVWGAGSGTDTLIVLRT